jgi:phosphatidylserine/phosphatidylglycerophosphate/cardiolipin synthase-like enzyme
MARKKESDTPRELRVGFVLLLVVILGALYMAREAGIALGPLEDLLPTAESEPGVPTPGGGVGGGDGADYFDVYFTTPANPDDGVRTGGIDERVVAAIGGAQSTVDIAAFEFNLQSVADALVAAHERGVRVRMVDDDEHTEDSEQMEQVREAGIPVVDDQRSAFMHNKFVVIDGAEVWGGSMNYTENDVFRNNNNLIHIVSPQIAANYTAEFEEMFLDEAFGPSSPANTPNQRIEIEGVRIENYFAPEDEPMERILAQVSRADTSIHFMSFSFTEDRLGQVMRDRAANGVEVMGIFEQRGANTEFSECKALLAQGIDVRLDGNPYTFHHKVIIVDGFVLITGSFNHSENATNSNDENLLVIHDPGAAALYEAEFNARWAEAQLPVGGECLSS